MIQIDEAGISHRDIKEENILVSEDGVTGKKKIKIIDFGLGSLVQDSPFSDFVGKIYALIYTCNYLRHF